MLVVRGVNLVERTVVQFLLIFKQIAFTTDSSWNPGAAMYRNDRFKGIGEDLERHPYLLKSCGYCEGELP